VLATGDIAYGLQNVKALSSSQALQNADSYTYYAICTLQPNEEIDTRGTLTRDFSDRFAMRPGQLRTDFYSCWWRFNSSRIRRWFMVVGLIGPEVSIDAVFNLSRITIEMLMKLGPCHDILYVDLVSHSFTNDHTCQ
jgi:hypothetical protein